MRFTKLQHDISVITFILSNLKDKGMDTEGERIAFTLTRNELLPLNISGNDFEAVLVNLELKQIIDHIGVPFGMFEDEHPTGLQAKYQLIVTDIGRLKQYLQKVEFETEYADVSQSTTYKNNDLVIDQCAPVHFRGKNAEILRFFFERRSNDKYYSFHNFEEAMKRSVGSKRFRRAIDEINTRISDETGIVGNPFIEAETDPAKLGIKSGKANRYRCSFRV